MRYIIHQIENGKIYNFRDLGLPNNIKIKSVWRIINENGDLLKIPLMHSINVQLESYNYTWWNWDNKFKYNPYDRKQHDIIIITEE
jgi:hypothetical protein